MAGSISRSSSKAPATSRCRCSATANDVVHCFERECSLQRRRQKVWEEAPSPLARRRDVARSSVRSRRRARQAVGYRGAGTLEYLYDDAAHDFYFIEMNTRIQVEHPVTEMVTGIDLVREMIRIAGGEPLALPPGRHRASAAMRSRCRINAEDPAQGFVPCPGTVTALSVPGGQRRPLRHACSIAGYTVPPFYDSPARQADRLGRGPRERDAHGSSARSASSNVEGVPTTKPLHQALARDPDVQAGALPYRAGSSAGSTTADLAASQAATADREKSVATDRP